MKLASLLPALSFLALASCPAAVIFTENFDGYTSPNPSGVQADTGLSVYYGGSLSGWSPAGTNAFHAVNLGSGNYALQIYDGPFFFPGLANLAIQSSGMVGSNILGTQYQVSFNIAPTTWNSGVEATTVSDFMEFELLDPGNNVVAYYSSAPGAWSGTASAQSAFISDAFTYTGTGSGDLRLRISAGNNGFGRFSGAIDNLVVATVPEPSRALLIMGGLLALPLRRRRNAASA